MIPECDNDGNLPAGIHWVGWDEIVTRYGVTPWRLQLLRGLLSALEALRSAGCRTVYLDGSFVTAKVVPNDFDGCWEHDGMDFSILDPVLLDFADGRAAQRAKFGGELLPARATVSEHGTLFLDFFQTDRDTGNRKGIIALDLGGLP